MYTKEEVEEYRVFIDDFFYSLHGSGREKHKDTLSEMVKFINAHAAEDEDPADMEEFWIELQYKYADEVITLDEMFNQISLQKWQEYKAEEQKFFGRMAEYVKKVGKNATIVPFIKFPAWLQSEENND